MTFITISAFREFVAHCVNAGDDGNPKTATLGGVMRGYISPQAQKAAIRNSVAHRALLGEHHLGVRTALIGTIIAKYLINDCSIAKANAIEVAKGICIALGSAKQGEEKSEDSEDAVDEAADIVEDTDDEEIVIATKVMNFYSHGDIERAKKIALAIANGERELPKEEKKKAETSSKKSSKKDDTASKKLVSARRDLAREILQPAPDMVDAALYGRMFAGLQDLNVEASVRVAFGLTTHRFKLDTDYFSARDEMKKAQASGAGHIGSKGFGSGVYYCVTTIDIEQTLKNLGGDVELLLKAVEWHVDGFLRATPQGRHANAFADCPAQYALVEVQEGQPVTHAAAFSKSIERIALEDESYLDASVRALTLHREEQAKHAGGAAVALETNESVNLDAIVRFAVEQARLAVSSEAAGFSIAAE